MLLRKRERAVDDLETPLRMDSRLCYHYGKQAYSWLGNGI